MDQPQYTREKAIADAKSRGDKFRRLSLGYGSRRVPIPKVKNPQTPKPHPPKNPDLDAYDLMSGDQFMASAKNPKKRRWPKRKRSKAIANDLKKRDGYDKYMQSDEWRRFRIDLYNQRGRKCEKCGITKGVFHVHHLHYKNLGKEKPEDVQILCKPCHMDIHGR